MKYYVVVCLGVVLVLFGVSGCSLFTMRRQPTQDYTRVKCTSSRAAPIMDTILAAGAGVATIVIVNDDKDFDKHSSYSMYDTVDHTSRIVATTALAATTVLYGTSALYGYHIANECDNIKVDVYNK